MNLSSGGGLVNGFVCQRSRSGHDTDFAGAVDVTRHDADFAFTGANHSGAIRTNETADLKFDEIG